MTDVANLEFLDSDLSEISATNIHINVQGLEFLDSALSELSATDVERDRYDFLNSILGELNGLSVHWSVGNLEIIGGDPHSEDPTVTNVSPAAASAIHPSSFISFDVTDDNNAFAELLIIANFPSLNILEVVYMDGVFSANYQALSSKNPITNGFHYSVLRTGGWPASPTFIVKAIDTHGNVNP